MVHAILLPSTHAKCTIAEGCGYPACHLAPPHAGEPLEGTRRERWKRRLKKPGTKIWLEAAPAGDKGIAKFIVAFSGIPAGTSLTLDFFEIPPATNQRHRARGQSSGDVKLGSVKGIMALNELATKLTGRPTFRLQVQSSAGTTTSSQTQATTIEIVIPGNDSLFFSLPHEAAEVDEGDWWHIQARCDSPKMQSIPAVATRMRRGVENRRTRYHWHRSHNLELYNDGATDAHGNGGAFADIVTAINAAQHFIFVVDWSFQPLFRPNITFRGQPTPVAMVPDTIGSLLVRRSSQLTVAVHTWKHTERFAPDPQNDDGGEWLDRIAKQLGLTSNVHWRAGSPSGISYSHHQKFVLLDQPASDGRRTFKVFFGGLDLTQGRLDWPAHPVACKDPDLSSRMLLCGIDDDNVNEWYNAETGGNTELPRQAWHDIYACMDGPGAWDFMREFVIRWGKSLSWSWEKGEGPLKSGDPIAAVWQEVCDHTKWVQQNDGTTAHSGPWIAQVARSNVSDRCAVLEELRDQPVAGQLARAVPEGSEASILESYRLGIEQAEHFIYIENQYLIGSGANFGEKSIANNIPEMLVRKILEKKQQGADFHVYVIVPMFPEGVPTDAGILEVRKNEFETIQYILRSIGDGWEDYFSLYFLAQWHPIAPGNWSSGDRTARLKAHQRYMVYVHSKLMIVDDRFLILGSANLNERSLAGSRDTEIACAFWPDRDHDGDCIAKLAAFRGRLFTEHFGAPLPGNPGSPACWQAAQAAGDRNYLSFRGMAATPVGHACRLPALIRNNKLFLGQPDAEPRPPTPDDWDAIPDSPARDKKWRWQCRGTYAGWTDAAE